MMPPPDGCQERNRNERPRTSFHESTETHRAALLHGCNMDAGYQITAAWMPPLFPVCCNPAVYQITATAAAMMPRQSARLGICCTSAAITEPGKARKEKGMEHLRTIPQRRNVTPLPEFYLTLPGIKELRLVLAPRGKYNICLVWPDANEDPKKIINGP